MGSCLRLFALIFGLAFVSAGVLGFMPSFTHDGLLLGYFMVDPIHNYVHLASGIVALLAAFNASYARLYFLVFGFIYGLVAVLGFAMHGDLHMLHMHFNMADNWLHTVIAVVALYLGFRCKVNRE